MELAAAPIHRIELLAGRPGMTMMTGEEVEVEAGAMTAGTEIVIETGVETETETEIETEIDIRRIVEEEIREVLPQRLERSVETVEKEEIVTVEEEIEIVIEETAHREIVLVHFLATTLGQVLLPPLSSSNSNSNSLRLLCCLI